MGKTILVVEDHEDSRVMMRLVIESYGYDVIEARDGLEAVETAQRVRPELILMDINMPRLDGLTAATMIRSLSHCSNLPIIAVTAFTDFRDKALEAGCVEVIRKPVEFRFLKKLIETHVG